MKKWTKEEAIHKIDELLKDAGQLSSSKPFSAEHTKWLFACFEILEEVFGQASRYYLTFSELSWKYTGKTIIEPWKYGGDHNAAIDALHKRAYLQQLDSAKGLLLAGKDYLSIRNIEDVYSGQDTLPEASAIMKILHLVERQLRKVIREKPEKEKQIQDSLENLFIGAEIDYSREKESIEYSTKNYIPDFTFAKTRMALDVKLCNRNEREKEIIAEINDDIIAYQTRYPNLIFVIYDLSFIRDSEKFCSSFEKHSNVQILVVKH